MYICTFDFFFFSIYEACLTYDVFESAGLNKLASGYCSVPNLLHFQEINFMYWTNELIHVTFFSRFFFNQFMTGQNDKGIAKSFVIAIFRTISQYKRQTSKSLQSQRSFLYKCTNPVVTVDPIKVKRYQINY